MNVLIADDEPVSRRLLEILLNKWGYEATVACDGDEAWHILQDGTCPRIAILDWMMPGLDGIQLCRRIRQRETRLHTYVLLLTAKQAAEDVNGGFKAGADDYLSKPYAVPELKARLRAATRIIELEDQLAAAREALKMETARDPLTGLWNRSSILEILHREVHIARRQSSPLAVLMAGIDYFEQIDHKHGHLAGDAVLREAARRIRSSIRVCDSMGRYGRGQFVIVSPACERAGALTQAHRVRSRVCQETIKTYETDLPVTVSLGITVCYSNHQAHELMSAAHSALAEARKTGHNRTALVLN